MKITGLQIDSYRHLQNLTFDFTYPEGHEKAGQPLEKICIIGQSATGKTGLLELVRDYLVSVNTIRHNGNYHFSAKPLTLIKSRIDFLKGEFNFQFSGNLLINYDSHSSYEIDVNKGNAGTALFYDPIFYLPSNLINENSLKIFSESPVNLLEASEYKSIVKNNQPLFENNVYDFSDSSNVVLWLKVVKDVLDYRAKFTQFASELISKGSIADFKKLNKEYEKWAQTNPNQLISFAEYFNPILNKLRLEVDLVNTEFSVPIRTLIKDEILPIGQLSTGTKSLLLTMFPIYALDSEDSIILIDEPERSLFPDMQIDLVGHYETLAPNAQFIIATHSPFIAAAFQPEERFILYFDEQGNVAVRRGEAPRGDDPNDMLRNDFHVSYYNEFGKQAYRDYLRLKQQMMQETDKEKKKELLIKLTTLGDQYNFDLNEKSNQA